MDTTYMALSKEERSLLLTVLESALKNTLIEEHRTRKPSYREAVIHQEELLDRMLGKLRPTVL
jgi:hypothetical protein